MISGLALCSLYASLSVAEVHAYREVGVLEEMCTGVPSRTKAEPLGFQV